MSDACSEPETNASKALEELTKKINQIAKYEFSEVISDLSNRSSNTSPYIMNEYIIQKYIFDIPDIWKSFVDKSDDVFASIKKSKDTRIAAIESAHKSAHQILTDEITTLRNSQKTAINESRENRLKEIHIHFESVEQIKADIKQVRANYTSPTSHWGSNDEYIIQKINSINKSDLSDVNKLQERYFHNKNRASHLNFSGIVGGPYTVAFASAILGAIVGGTTQTLVTLSIGAIGGGLLGFAISDFYIKSVAEKCKDAFFRYLDSAAHVIYYHEKMQKEISDSGVQDDLSVGDSLAVAEGVISGRIQELFKRRASDIESQNRAHTAQDIKLRKTSGRIISELRNVIDNLRQATNALSEPRDFINASPAFVLGYVQSSAQFSSIKSDIIENNSFSDLNISKIPVLWCFSELKSLLLFYPHQETKYAEAIATNVLTQILQKLPGGKVQFIFFDPHGLGANVSRFLPLGDYSDQLISGKVWSSREHMRVRIKNLIEHIEIVTQKYLRSQYVDIASYNAEAGDIAEPYKILVVHGYPDNFDDEMIADLSKVLKNGPRCGVFSIIIGAYSVERMEAKVSLFRKDCYEIRTSPRDKSCAVVNFLSSDQKESNDAEKKRAPIFGMVPEDQFSDQTISDAVKKFGEESRHSVKIVAYDKLIVANGSKADPWSASAIERVKLPLGPRGAKELQQFDIGSGLLHHALVVGRPGSGKSNLFHVLIATLCQTYSPREAQLYLIDFKKGVEFKCYADARLPHARVIAVESEREFGLSVLEELDKELSRRGALFRRASKNNLPEYRSQFPNESLPRLILIVDEFQEFFSRRDKIETEAAIILDRLVRQGRSFGIHVILGTQTLSNSGLATSTKDQIAIRVALQCSEADSRLILDSDNTAARLLSKPGEAIYNDKAGLVEGNTLFQIAMFSEEDRTSVLGRINSIAKQKSWKGRPPIIFEGHEPADLELSLSSFDEDAVVAVPVKKDVIELTLGDPVSIGPLMSLPLLREQGGNMILLTRDEEQASGVIAGSLIQLLSTPSASTCRIEFVNLQSTDGDFADLLNSCTASCQGSFHLRDRKSLKSLLPNIESEVRRRVTSESRAEKTVLLVLFGIHRARELRIEETGGRSMFSFSEQREAEGGLSKSLATILRDGPEVGIHVVVWSDALISLEKCFDRGALSPFSLRVSGPLSFDDSRKVFDSEAASNIDKPFRMVAFDDTKLGDYTLFRPFKLPAITYVKSMLRAPKKEKAD